MSRHRDVRNLDYDEEYDDAYHEDVYGHSVDEYEYGVSPSAEQYLYSRSREKNYGFGAYFPDKEEIKEESEGDEEDLPQASALRRQDSSSYTRPHLSSEDQAKLNSVLDEIRNVVGDQFSEAEMVQTVLELQYNFEAALNSLLTRNQKGPASERPTYKTPAGEEDKELTMAAGKDSRSQGYDSLSSGSKVEEVRKVDSIVVTTPGKGNKTVKGFRPQENGIVESNEYLGKGQQIDEGLESPQVLEEGTDNKEAAVYVQRPITKIRDKDINIEAKYKEERGADKPMANLVVVGHVDAGKSTLMGHLLYLKGNVSQRTMHKYEQESKKLGKQAFMYAWVLDDTDEERSRGVTVDVAQRSFNTASKCITLLDAPGHRDFIPNMITGASRADVAVLVVDATRGGFEAGFESGGQTREHAILIRSLGISQLTVAINKLDQAEWSQKRFEEIKTSLRNFLKTVGFRNNDIVYIPCSGLTGENLVEKAKEPELLKWYKGVTLLEAIDNMKIPDRAINRPVRLCINDVFKSQGASTGLAGRLETGYIQNGDRLLLLPQSEILNVKTVQIEGQEHSTCAFAGDHTVVNAVVPSSVFPHIGDFLSDPVNTIPMTTRIAARIVVFNITVPIIKGSQFDFYYQSVSEGARIRKLVSLIHKSTGQIIKERPRALIRNSSAVVHIEMDRPLCVEVYKDYKELGRFMLRNSGVTVAAGMITQILN